MCPIYYDNESKELDNLQQQIQNSDLRASVQILPIGAIKIFQSEPSPLVLYFVRKNGSLKPESASTLKQNYQSSKIGCICAGDCHLTKDLALESGADFFLVSTYDSFIEDLERNIKSLGVENFDSHKIERDTPELSKDELMLVRYLVSGLTEKQIAEKLCIGYESLKKKKKYIIQKLHLRNHADLSNWAAFNICTIDPAATFDPLLKGFLERKTKLVHG